MEEGRLGFEGNEESLGAGGDGDTLWWGHGTFPLVLPCQILTLFSSVWKSRYFPRLSLGGFISEPPDQAL